MSINIFNDCLEINFEYKHNHVDECEFYICRCGKIDKVFINKFYIDRFINKFINKDKDTLEEINNIKSLLYNPIIDNILLKMMINNINMLSNKTWEFNIINGKYLEIVDTYSLKSSIYNRLDDFYNRVLNETDIKNKILIVFEYIYGYVPTKLKLGELIGDMNDYHWVRLVSDNNDTKLLPMAEPVLTVELLEHSINIFNINIKYLDLVV